MECEDKNYYFRLNFGGNWTGVWHFVTELALKFLPVQVYRMCSTVRAVTAMYRMCSTVRAVTAMFRMCSTVRAVTAMYRMCSTVRAVTAMYRMCSTVRAPTRLLAVLKHSGIRQVTGMCFFRHYSVVLCRQPLSK